MPRMVPVGATEVVPLELLSSAVNTVRIHSDAVGAAHLMRELLGTEAPHVALVEEQGQWHVVVRVGRDVGEAVQKVLAIVRDALDAGLAGFASVHVGARTCRLPDRSHAAA
jgi:hypothetical protein